MSAQEEGAKEQDKYLPIANIARIMKKALPPNAKVAKDAKETVQECVSEFISFITSEVRLGRGERKRESGGQCRGGSICNARRPSFFFSFSFAVRRPTSSLPLSLSLSSLFSPKPPQLRSALALTLKPLKRIPWGVGGKNSQASDKCQREKRKTINGDDLLWALSTLGFECYVDPLKAYLAKYRESEKNAMAAGGGGGKGGEEGDAEPGPSADGGGETD